MKKIIPIAIALALMLAVPVFAVSLGRQRSNVNFQDASVSEAELAIVEETFTTSAPADNALYPVKRLGEVVREFLTFGKAEKAKLHLQFAVERLAEAKDMISKNKTSQADALLDDFEDEINQTVNLTRELRGIGQNVSSLLKEVDDATSKSSLALELVIQKAPESARPALERALNNSLEKRAGVEEENEAEEMSKEQARERAQERAETNQITGKTIADERKGPK